MTLPQRCIASIAAAFFLPVALLSADDNDPVPLGSLGGRALQQPGSGLLKITEVTAGGPAASAGLRVGDFIHSARGAVLSATSPSINDGWRGAVSELGQAIERAESIDRTLSLGVFRPGTGAVNLNATLPANTAWRPSYPLGDARADSLFEKACADLHTKIQASSGFGYNTGWFGMSLLASPNWNDTTGAKPYRNSINKIRDACVSYLNGAILEPVEPGAAGYVNPGLENWDVTSACMFIGEYRRKTGDTTVDGAVQRAALLLANRIQHYDQRDDSGVLYTYKHGIMGHGGVTGDYAHLWLTGINIINAHATVAMGILKGAGADFSAISGSSGLTIDQKFLMNWSWLKACTRTDGGDDDGCVGYQGVESGWDAAGRTAGSAAGYQIYLNAGGTAANADDLDKLARMKAYVSRQWQRQQHAHAYTAGGVALSQCLMPFLSDRAQRHFMENSRFYFTLSRDHSGAIQYVPGRGNNGGDSYLDFNNVKYFMTGLFHAMSSGNLPSFPAPSASRAFVRMNAPANDWPQLAARRAKVVGLVQNLDLDVTNHLGSVISSGYTAVWSQVSGVPVAFSTTASEDTTVTFPAAGTYRLRMAAAVGGYPVTEDYDFEVAATTPPPVANTIATQPVSRVGVPGGSAALTVAAAGDGPFLYEWKLNGTAYWGSSATGTLAISNLAPGHAGNYTCTIYTPGGTLTSNTAVLSIPTTTATTAGGLKREVWTGLSGGSVADLTGSSAYPLFPDVTSVATSIETPSGYGDSYGERYSGWLVPPTTGSYKFFVTSDDASEVWLSTTDSPANKVRICQVTGWTNYRAYPSGGQSAFITLTAGNRYYIEVLHKEGGGGDHLSLAWQLPGGSAPAANAEPIGAANLEYEAVTPDPALNGLVSWWRMNEGSGTVAADVLATANDGTLNAPAWTTGKQGGALVFDGNDRVTCSNRGALDGSTPFSVTAWVKVNSGANADAVVVQQRAANGYNGQYQVKVTAAGKAGFYVYGNSAEQFNFAGATSINDGKWHHVAAVRDGSGNAFIFVDGVRDGSVTGTTVRGLAGSIDVGIGCDIRDSNKFFRGAIDDVRVYNIALSQSQVQAVSAIGNSTPGFVANPFSKPDAAAGIDYSQSLAGSASDADFADAVTFSKTSGPAWLAVAPNGDLTGTPTVSNVGTNTFVVRVTDSNGAFSEATLTINVAPPKQAPAFTQDPIVVKALKGNALSAALSATDADAGETLTYTKVSGPAWLGVSSNGTLTGTPLAADVGSNAFVVRVTDPNGLYDEAALSVEVINEPAWTNSAGGGWPVAGNWLAGFVAGGTANVADFSSLNLAADTVVTLDGARTIGGLVFGDTTPSHGWTLNAGTGGTLTLQSAGTPVIQVANQSATLGVTIAGTSGFTKTGAGTLVLNASNTYTGNTTINAGVLELSASGRIYNSAYNNTSVVTVNSGGTWRMPDFSYVAMGQLADYRQRRVLNGGAIEITGPTHSSGQDFTVNATGGIFRYTNSGGTLTLSGNANSNILTDGALELNAIGNMTITETIEGAGSLVKSGPGTVLLNQIANSLTGNITVNEGTLQTGAGVGGGTTGHLGAVSAARTITIAGGTLSFTGNNVFGGAGKSAATIPTVSINGGTLASTRFNILGDITLQGGVLSQSTTDTGSYEGYQFLGTITVGGGAASTISSGNGRANHLINGTTTFNIANATGDKLADLIVSAPLRNSSGDYGSSAGSLAKTGAGTMQLSAVNTYTGTTTVSAGTLAVTGSIAASATTVAAGATLAGTGTLNGATTNHGTLAPGMNAVGTLTIANTLTLAPDSSIEWQLSDWTGAAGSGFDRLVVNAATLSATSSNPVVIRISGTPANFSETSKTFVLVQSSGAVSGFGAAKFSIDTSGLSTGSGTWAVQQSGNNLLLAYTRANRAPEFAVSSISHADATAGTPYIATLAGAASDPDAGDTISFSKIAGPAWLTVAAGGALSGTPSASDAGSNSFTVRVTDALGLNAEATLGIHVVLPNADANGNGMDDAWEIAKFGNANAGANLPNADPDGDGLVNLLEFAVDTHPMQANASPVVCDIHKVGADSFLRLTAPKNPLASKLGYVVETCGTSGNWTSAGNVVMTDGASQIIARDGVPVGTSSRRFIRLKVTTSP